MTPTTRMTFTALFVALTAVATLFLSFRGPTGYYHLGDGVYYTAALLFGPAAGAAAGGLGGALADVLGGYANYAPITLVVKGLGGYLAGLIALGSHGWGRRLPALLAAAAVTVIGYPLAAWIMFGWPAALTEFYLDVGQTAVGILVAAVLVRVLEPVVDRRPV